MLGEGGMGMVYEAEDIRLGRRVAVKVLHSDSRGDTEVERLFREARIAAAVQHDAIVLPFGYGSDPDLDIDYIVMERLYGETLQQRIQRAKPLPVSWVLQLGLDIAHALAAVHASGAVHRDLKPSNIFLAARGRRVDDVKLLDFGLSKRLDFTTLTRPGEIRGTPMYMAPEQFSDFRNVDSRADVYAFGAILFECLSGAPPFRASNPLALAVHIVCGSQPNLALLRPKLPEKLVRIVHRCMRKRADERFANARKVFDALSAVPQSDVTPGG
jgi:serine/threonine protein kinase